RRHTRFSRDWSSDVCSSDLYRDEFVGSDTRGREASFTTYYHDFLGLYLRYYTLDAIYRSWSDVASDYRLDSIRRNDCSYVASDSYRCGVMLCNYPRELRYEEAGSLRGFFRRREEKRA